MTIDSAFRRIIHGHWLLIALITALVPSVVLVLALREPPAYVAQSRIQVGAAVAASQVQADAASARVLGLATSPGVVTRALTTAGVRATPTAVAEHISVTRIGLSPVVEISVSWTSRPVAESLAASITEQVLAFANDSGYGEEAKRIAALDSSITTSQASRDKLIPQLDSASPGRVLTIQAQLNAIDTVLQDNLQQRSNLIVAAAGRSNSVLVDPVWVAEPAGSLPIIKRTLLAALAGLLLALAVAAGVETLRPRLRGRAIADALNTVHIGTFRQPDGYATWWPASVPMARRVQILARAAGAREILILPLESADDTAAHVAAEVITTSSEGMSGHLPASLFTERLGHSASPAVVLAIAPRIVPGHVVEDTRHLLDTAGLSLIGLVTYEGELRFAEPHLAVMTHDEHVVAGSEG